MVDQALAIVVHWLAVLLGFVLSLFALVTGAMRHLMAGLHIAPGVQTIIMVLVTVALIIAVLRVFGGVVRVLLLVFLVLLLVRMVM